MKLIFTLAMTFILQSSLFSQKGKTVTEYYYKELKSAEGKLDKDGKKTGEWSFWDVKGNLCEKRTYKNDLLDGLFTVEKVLPKQNSYFLKELQNKESLYNLAILKQTNQKLDTIISKVNYVKDLKEGVEVIYSKNGIIEKEINYVNGMPLGLTKKYNDKGELSVLSYRNAIDEDSSIEYYTNREYDLRKWYKKDFGSECYFYLNGKLIRSANRIKSGNILNVAKCTWENNAPISCDTSTIDLLIYDEYGRKRNSDNELVVVDMPTKNEVVVEEIFDVVEEMPQFPGGNAELYKFISSNYTMDSTMKSQAIAGKIYVSFVIDKDGSVTQAKVLRGLSEPLDKEAIRVVNLMPKWIPGKQRGKEVKVRYNLPIVVKWN